MPATVVVGLVALAGGYYLARPALFSSSQPAVPSTAAVSSEASVQAKSTQNPSSAQPSASSDTLPVTQATNPGSSPASSPGSSSSPQPNPSPACDDKTAQLVKKYNSDVAKERKSLDLQLGFPPVGANISIMYVEEFNDTVQDIYDGAVKSATDAHCVFPLTQPSLLPLSYPS